MTRRRHVAPLGEQIRLFILIIVGLFLCSPATLFVQAAAGDLDPTFGNAGLVVTEFPPDPILGGDDKVRAVMLAPDGKILVVGDNTKGILLARYHPDGSLDHAFGSGGKVDARLFNGVIEVHGAALAADGKIVVVGYTLTPETNPDFALARYESSSPRIGSVSLSGKNLLIFGDDFDSGAVILLNGVEQKTRNENNHPNSELIGKQTAKRITPGQTVMLQVKNADGALSPIFPFTRPAG